MFQRAVCDNDSWSLIINNLNQKTKYNLYFYQEQTVYNFDYTGAEQIFTVQISGTYKLETWGAKGGSVNETYIGGDHFLPCWWWFWLYRPPF